MFLTSGLILATFLVVDSLFFFRRASDERLRSGSRQRKGCDGFREEDLSPVATQGCRGGPPPFTGHSSTTNQAPKFSLRFCHEQSVSIFSSLQVLPSSHYFTAFQRNFCSLGEINLRFRDPPTSVWSRFQITSHGGSTSRPRNHYSSKTSLNADASKLVSIFFASVLKLICSAMKSLSIRRRWSSK